MVEVKYSKPKYLWHENKQAGGLRTRPADVPSRFWVCCSCMSFQSFSALPRRLARSPLLQANAHVTYPACLQLVGTMNPCRCGYLTMWPRPVTGRLSAARIIRYKHLVRSSALWMCKWMCHRHCRLILDCHHQGRVRRTLLPRRRRLEEGSMHRIVS